MPATAVNSRLNVTYCRISPLDGTSIGSLQSLQSHFSITVSNTYWGISLVTETVKTKGGTTCIDFFNTRFSCF